MKHSEERIQRAKSRIFEQIDVLLQTGDLESVSFAKIADGLGCRPNSVVYYFEDKMDMLVQYIQSHVVTSDINLSRMDIFSFNL